MLINSRPKLISAWLAFLAASLSILPPVSQASAQSKALLVQSSATMQASEETGDSGVTIRGVVLSTVDQRPLPGALVTLSPDRRTALTDNRGGFAFSGLRQGPEMYVSVKKLGYLCSPLMRTRPQPNCYQSVGVKSNDLQLTMTLMPQAVVTGRIVNQAGEPIRDLTVSLLARDIRGGRYVWSLVQPISKTDAEGVFRVTDLEPGTYLLRTAASAIVHVPFGKDFGYEATWYPGTSIQEGAKPIVLTAGEEFKANLAVKESLTLINIPYAWNHPDREGPVLFGLTAGEPVDSVHPFLAANYHLFQVYAPYGRYFFNLCISPSSRSWSDGTTEPYCGSEALTITDRTASVPSLPLQQPISIPLHVRAELTQQEQRGSLEERNNQLYSPPWAAFSLIAGTSRLINEITWQPKRPDAELAFKAVPAGEYTLVAVCQQDCYFASLTCGSVNLLRNPLVVGGDTPRCSVEAMVRDDFATVAVRLSPLAISRMNAAGVKQSEVFLIPLDNVLQRPPSGVVAAGPQPSKIKIIPGRYLALLFDGRNLAWREPDVQKHLMTLGKVLSLKPGDLQTVVLDWMPELNDLGNSYPAPSVSVFVP